MSGKFFNADGALGYFWSFDDETSGIGSEMILLPTVIDIVNDNEGTDEDYTKIIHGKII